MPPLVERRQYRSLAFDAADLLDIVNGFLKSMPSPALCDFRVVQFGVECLMMTHVIDNAALQARSVVVGGVDFKREVRAFGGCLGMHRR